MSGLLSPGINFEAPLAVIVVRHEPGNAAMNAFKRHSGLLGYNRGGSRFSRHRVAIDTRGETLAVERPNFACLVLWPVEQPILADALG